MKKTESLKKNDEFRRVFTKGRWFKGKYVVLYILKNKFEINRLGIAVGRKTGKSYERNRIRRLIREIYRTNENSFSTGYDIIILWKGKDNDIFFSTLKEDIIELLKKTEIWSSDE